MSRQQNPHPAPTCEQRRRFIQDILYNPYNREVLARLPALGLSGTLLVAGCLAQTIWNLRSGRPPEEGIKDYDVFYFDDGDASWEAEDTVIRRAQIAFADLPVMVEIRNQARVHLWYRDRFGAPYPQLVSAEDGIDRFLVPCTSVGVEPTEGGELRVYTPYGLDELYDGVLRPNPLNVQSARFEEKVASYQSRWPWLTILRT